MKHVKKFNESVDKNTLREVASAIYSLGDIEKFEQEFDKNPNCFTLKCNLRGLVFEVPSNEIIQSEVKKYFEELKKKNQDIIDSNPELAKKILES